MNVKRALPSIAIVAVSLAGCGGGKQTPVARAEVDPKVVRLPFGQSQTVHLTFNPSAPLEGDAPTVFVHLLGSDKKVARTFDHPLPKGWQEGAALTDDFRVYQSAIAPPLDAGTYQVTIGLYGKDGKRWALDGLGEPVARDEYNAFQIEVPAQNGRPRFGFMQTWEQPLAGGDKQVVARRWMPEQAAVRILEQPGPGAVWLMVQIPATDSPDYKLDLKPGASSPAVTVNGNCGGTETSFSGPGIHEAEIAVDAPPPGGFCRFVLTSNFTIQSQTRGPKRSVSLENIAWISAGARRAAAPEGSPAPAPSPASPSVPK